MRLPRPQVLGCRSVEVIVGHPVTALTAAIAVFVLFNRTIVAADMFVGTVKVVGMTRSAERCVLRKRIVKCGIHTGTMAVFAAWVATVVAWIVAVRVVGEVCRCPAVC